MYIIWCSCFFRDVECLFLYMCCYFLFFCARPSRPIFDNTSVHLQNHYSTCWSSISHVCTCPIVVAYLTADLLLSLRTFAQYPRGAFFHVKQQTCQAFVFSVDKWRTKLRNRAFSFLSSMKKLALLFSRLGTSHTTTTTHVFFKKQKHSSEPSLMYPTDVPGLRRHVQGIPLFGGLFRNARPRANELPRYLGVSSHSSCQQGRPTVVRNWGTLRPRSQQLPHNAFQDQTRRRDREGRREGGGVNT